MDEITIKQYNVYGNGEFEKGFDTKKEAQEYAIFKKSKFPKYSFEVKKTDQIYLLTPKQRSYLAKQYEKALISYQQEGLSDKVAEKRAYRDVYGTDRKAILSELDKPGYMTPKEKWEQELAIAKHTARMSKSHLSSKRNTRRARKSSRLGEVY